jgi:hypothetical protein
MEQTDKTRTQDTAMLARATAMSAGDVSIAVRAELTRLLAANGGDRWKALPSGFGRLVEQEALSKAEAAELQGVPQSSFPRSAIA